MGMICDHAALFGEVMTQMAELGAGFELTQRSAQIECRQVFDTAATLQ
jgi:hypothetical protein